MFDSYFAYILAFRKPFLSSKNTGFFTGKMRTVETDLNPPECVNVLC